EGDHDVFAVARAARARAPLRLPVDLERMADHPASHVADAPRGRLTLGVADRLALLPGRTLAGAAREVAPALARAGRRDRFAERADRAGRGGGAGGRLAGEVALREQRDREADQAEHDEAHA